MSRRRRLPNALDVFLRTVRAEHGIEHLLAGDLLRSGTGALWSATVFLFDYA